MYDAVPSLVDERIRLAAFPDGSVDVFGRVRDHDGQWLSVGSFRERVGGRSQGFRIGRRNARPGGQAVNAARQAHALGDEVRLDGCLDDERLTFPFETHSFGEPTRVEVHEFTDSDVLYAGVSPDLREWTHEAFESVPEADAYVCGNWASVDGMTDSLSALAGRLSGEAFVFDPGDWTDAAADALRECCEALATLDESVDVVVSVNGPELAALADALGVAEAPAAVRPEAGVSGVVRHETGAAVGATRGTETTVPNVDPDEIRRRTGGGDRFTAGLAHGLGAGGDLEAALALGNCCASHYVATGRTGTAERLVAFAEEHRP